MSKLALLLVLACACGSAAAQRETRIYQQRDAYGNLILTDRPAAGAQTERAWRFAPEDAEAARERREQALREVQAINERFDRQLAQQRQHEHEMELARLRLAEERMRLDAQQRDDDEVLALGWPVAVRPSFAHRIGARPPRDGHRPHVPRPPKFGRFGPQRTD